MIEPLTSLEYLARDFEKRYGVRCKVEASVDSDGTRTLRVFAWRREHWVEQMDAFETVDDAPPPPAWDSKPVRTAP